MITPSKSVLAGDSASEQDRGFGFGGGSISIEDEPEVRAMLEEAARQHWASWFDKPVPALADMSPRQAAKTAEGRELLNNLLLFYGHSADRSSDKTSQPDLAALRRELGID